MIPNIQYYHDVQELSSKFSKMNIFTFHVSNGFFECINHIVTPIHGQNGTGKHYIRESKVTSIEQASLNRISIT